MRRRDFVLGAGVALARPFAVGAQQRTTPTIGILLYNSRTQHGGEDHPLILGFAMSGWSTARRRGCSCARPKATSSGCRNLRPS